MRTEVSDDSITAGHERACNRPGSNWELSEPSVAFPYPSPAWLTAYYGAIGTGDRRADSRTGASKNIQLAN